MVVLSFWFLSLYFWNMSFFVFILDAIFCGTFFFFFQDSVWLVKSSWCVHCCTIHKFFWVSDSCRSEFALWWFFVRKKLSSQYWQFFFLFRLDYQTILVFISLRDRAAFLGLIMRFFTCWCYLGLLNNCFQFFFCGIMSFYVSISDLVFLVTSFSIFDHSVWLILSFRWAQFDSFIQFHWGSGHYTSEFELECFCLIKVITNW